MNRFVLGIVAVLILLAVAVVSRYNNLVAMSENVSGKWSQVETQLQRRADLIPNLINTVKGYAAHEQQSIQVVADARAKLAGSQGPAAKGEANVELSNALSRLLVVVENYPTLKADKNFRALLDELSGTENRLSIARKDYNESVQGYNTTIRSLPDSFYARIFGFDAKEYFKADEIARQTPQVKF